MLLAERHADVAIDAGVKVVMRVDDELGLIEAHCVTRIA
ncbi:hypothetical protein BH11PSE11_BH11PSE11_08720 [soil metagenome]